jgi:metal-sulfur cluster biosynthetic enzyme
MIDSERAVAIRSTLAADGYEMKMAQVGGRVEVTITATEQACPDCLVPEDLMRGILGQALGVPPDTIDLTYPAPSQPER